MSDIKYMVKSKKLKRNWTRRENFDICFCVSFNHSRQKIIFGGKTGNQPVYGLISCDPKSLVFQQLVRQLIYKFVYSRYQVLALFMAN